MYSSRPQLNSPAERDRAAPRQALRRAQTWGTAPALEISAPALEGSARLEPKVFTGLVLSSILLLGGCSVETQDPIDLEEVASAPQLRAVVEVQRTMTLDAPFELQDSTQQVDGEAMASLVTLQDLSDAEAWQALRDAGLLSSFPNVGECSQSVGAPPREPSPSVDAEGNLRASSSSPQLALADLHDFNLYAGAHPHEMAARAFPGISPQLRGVVYTSRERSGKQLSLHNAFELSASGSDGEEITGYFSGPEAPQSVWLQGVELAQVQSLNLAEAHAEFDWSVESRKPGQVVVISLRQERATLTCSFEANSGHGLLPLSSFAEPSTFVTEQAEDALGWLHFRVISQQEELSRTDSADESLGFFAQVESSWLMPLLFSSPE